MATKTKKGKVTVEEIASKASKFFGDNTYIKLRTRMDDDYKLWRLNKYDAGKNYYSYTSNLPLVYANKIIAILSQAKLSIRFPVKLQKDVRSQGDKIERFLYGVLNLIDDVYIARGEPTLRNQLAWFSAIRGGFGLRAMLYKNEYGETVPDITPFDRYNFAYEKGRTGLLWAVHRRTAVPAASILDEYGVEIGKDKVDLLDYYDGVNNAVVADGQFLKKPTPHGCNYTPVFLINAGYTPSTWGSVSEQTPGLYIGESIYAANRAVYPIINKVVSDLATLVRRGVKPPMVRKTIGGRGGNIDTDPFGVEKAAFIDLDLNESISPLIPPSMPQDASALMGILSEEEQLGAFPKVSYGQVGQRMSGFAINQLMGATETTATPFIDALNRAYQMACLSLLDQFADGGWEGVAVRGKDSKGQAFGVPMPDEIQPMDIVKGWHPEISLTPILPKDDAQNYQMAMVAKQADLLSTRSIQDAILGVEDTDMEEKLQRLEWASKNIPLVRLFQSYLDAVEANDPDTAKNILIEVRRVFPQMGANGAAGGAQPPVPPRPLTSNPTQQASMESPGVGIPVQDMGGMPPSTLPPEALGGMPPGALSALSGEV